MTGSKPRRLSVRKYSATGNTFVLLDLRDAANRALKAASLPAAARRLSGEFATDGLIAISGVKSSKPAVRMTFFNPDGSRAFCGNGTRTSGFYEWGRRRVPPGGAIMVLTDAGAIPVGVKKSAAALLNIEPPRFMEPAAVEIEAGGSLSAIFHRVWSGCPHAVCLVPSVRDAAVESIGRSVRYHRAFAPEGTNVDFVEVLAPGRLAVRTYERGVERETKSCGSGVLASVFAAKSLGKIPGPIADVQTQGGRMKVVADGGHYGLEGGIDLVFEGGVFI
ncbi:MAG: diaminopimelate epimerase [Elusimicrobia bacterium]|nr:diaminopimelate epimerase [Elusimicrobiota bacterium]